MFFFLPYFFPTILSLHHDGVTAKVKARCSVLVHGGRDDDEKWKYEWARRRVHVSSTRSQLWECVVVAVMVKCVATTTLKGVRQSH